MNTMFCDKGLHRGIGRRTMIANPLNTIVQTCGSKETRGYGDIQLHLGATVKDIAHMPSDNDQTIEEDDIQRRNDVAATQGDKHMVEVSLIRTERRATLQHTGSHNSQSIEHGHSQYGQREADRRARNHIIARLDNSHHKERADKAQHL